MKMKNLIVALTYNIQVAREINLDVAKCTATIELFAYSRRDRDGNREKVTTTKFMNKCLVARVFVFVCVLFVSCPDESFFCRCTSNGYDADDVRRL